MKQKDPRQKLNFWLRVFFLLVFIFPFLYLNIKQNRIINISIFLILYFGVALILKKIYPHKKEVDYGQQILLAHIFSGILFFLTFSFLFGIFVFDYLEKGIVPNTNYLIISGFIILISAVLFSLANKSRIYEKKVLRKKENINYKNLSYLYWICFVGFVILLTIIHYVF